MKKIISAALCVIMVFSLMAVLGACSGDKKDTGTQGQSGLGTLANVYPEFSTHRTVTFTTTFMTTVGAGYDPELDIFANELEKRTNLRLVPKVDTELEDRLSLFAASGDVPDFMGIYTASNYESVDAMGRGGLIWDLKPYVQDMKSLYPMIKYDLILNEAADGGYYALPTLPGMLIGLPGDVPSVMSGVFVREDFLKQLGMEYPSTPETFYEYLVRCRDEIKTYNGLPIVGYVQSGSDYYTGWMLARIFFPLPGLGPDYYWLSGFGVDKPNNFQVVNYEYTDSPELLRACKYINKLYREGLMPNVVTLFGNDYEKILSTGQAAAVGAWAWDAQTANAVLQQTDPDGIYICTTPIFDATNGVLKYPDEKYSLYGASYVMATISKKLDEATLKHILAVVDYLSTEEGSMLMMAGVEGVTYEYLPDGTWNYTTDFLAKTNGGDDSSLSKYGLGRISAWVYVLNSQAPALRNRVTTLENYADMKGYENWKPFLMSKLDPDMEPTKDYFMKDGPIKKSLQQDMDFAKNEMYAQCILASSEEEVERIIRDYGDRQRRLGVDDVTAEMQAYLDNFTLAD